MCRLDHLTRAVRDLYEAKNPNRDDWADWMYLNHVFVVADYARKVADQFGLDAELAEAAAMLHDIADVEMGRVSDDHETRSLEIARDLLTDNGFSADETNMLVDDAIRYHSCHGDESPKSDVGKVLATADAMGHLQTDFYLYATWFMGSRDKFEDVKDWALKKLDRDFYKKIAFPEVQAACRPDYEMLKNLFSR